MTAGLGHRRPSLLLVEPQSLMRRTVASVARELGLAEIHETSSVDSAAKLLATSRFDALVIDLDRAGAALELMSLLRRGGCRCETTIPIVALAEACDAHTVTRLKDLEVRRILLKPFKVKGVLDSMASLWPVPAMAS